MKKLTALLLALVMLLSLTACGAKVDAPATEAATAPAPAPDEATAAPAANNGLNPTRRSPCICTALQTSLMLVLKARSTWSPALRCPVTMN